MLSVMVSGMSTYKNSAGDKTEYLGDTLCIQILYVNTGFHTVVLT